MSFCGQVTPNTVSETTLPSVQEAGEALSLSEKIYTMGSDLFSAAANFAYENPIATGVIVVGSILVVGGLLYATRETPLPDLQPVMEKVDSLLKEGQFDQAEKLVDKYVNDLFQATKFKEGLPKGSINEDSKKYLSSKIYDVCSRPFSPEVKEKIVNNVVADTKKLLTNAEKRVKTDLASGHLTRLVSDQNATITNIKPLGDESHNEGKIPLKITFSNGESIVYKPRSMLPESVLFDSQEGLFKDIGFGTYNVVCGYDEAEGEAYGYADFIVNNVGEQSNTVGTPQELEQYLEKLCLLDLVGLELGISDLHFKNIMTQDLDPKVTDAEVYLTPQDVPTGMWDASAQGAGVTFDLCAGKEYLGSNRISFASSFRKRNLFKYEMPEENLQAVGINRSKIQETCAQRLPELLGKINTAKEHLRLQPGRFVFIDTKSMKDEMRGLDPTNEVKIDEAVQLMRRTFDDFDGYEFDESSVGQIKEQLKKDAMHNDIPTFCHDSRNRTVLYNGIVIGRYEG